MATKMDTRAKISVKTPAMDLFTTLYTSHRGAEGKVRRRMYLGIFMRMLRVVNIMAARGKSESGPFHEKTPERAIAPQKTKSQAKLSAHLLPRWE